MTKVLQTGSVLIALALALGCSAPGPSWPTDGSVTVALENAPINLDPRVGTDQSSGRVAELVLEGLVRKDPQGNLLPALAESWEILDDGNRYRFHLVDDAVFHDGQPMTAADVAWTFQTIVDGTVSSPKRGAFQMVEEVVAVDDHTVDFYLYRPHGALLADLTAEQGVIQNGRSPEDSNDRLIGTGPFRFDSRTPDTITVVANEDYRHGKPRITRVTLREIPDSTVRALELRKGSVQLVVNGLTPDQVPTFREDPSYRVVETPGSNYVYLGINLEDPILKERKVRRAIALAIDRQQLVDTLRRGLGHLTETMMPSGHWARNEELEPIPFDVAEAKKLLDEAGYPDPDGDGPEMRFRLTYKTSTNEEGLLQAQIAQAMLAAAGIGIDIRSYEFATFYSDVKQGNFQLFSLTWTGVIDPHIYNLVLHSASIPPAGSNRGRYRNERFDHLIEQGSQPVDPVERRPHYLEAQQILADELPYISLFHKVNVAVMAAELEGYESFLSGEIYSLKTMAWTSPGS